MTTSPKHAWQGEILSVQPRIRLTRSFDQRTHAYLGYVLFAARNARQEERTFTVAIGEAAQAKHAFRVGVKGDGQAQPVLDAQRETADLYKVSGLRVLDTPPELKPVAPWVGSPPELPTYQERGHRRLAKQTYEKKWRSCIWGCEMPITASAAP